MGHLTASPVASMVRTLELLRPTSTLRESYRSLVREFVAAGENPVPFVLGFENDADLGLARVLVTCGKENRGSVMAIVRNGGVLDSEEFLVDRDEVVQRYWIPVGTRGRFESDENGRSSR